MTSTLTATAATPASEALPRWRGSNAFTQVRVLTARSLRALAADPRMVVMSLLQPVIMLVLFTQVFGGAVGAGALPGGLTYVDFLMPAILVNTAMQSAIQAGVGLVTDMKNGVLARFRSLPIHFGSILVARSLSDLVRTGLQLVIMLVLATAAFGFAPAGGVLGVVAALALALLVGWGLTWVFLAIGAWLRNAETMQGVSFLVMFPLMFASSAYVPVAHLPAWLRAVANVNPLTHAVDAARSLALGTPVGGAALGAVITALALAGVGAWVANRGFRRPL
jgi:ABC-2 type transport system permease protein